MEPLTKNTSVRITIGALIGLLFAGVAVDRRFGKLEMDAVNHEDEISTLRRRQNTYIDRRDTQHSLTREELLEVHSRVNAMCEELSARYGERICG